MAKKCWGVTRRLGTDNWELPTRFFSTFEACHHVLVNDSISSHPKNCLT